MKKFLLDSKWSLTILLLLAFILGCSLAPLLPPTQIEPTPTQATVDSVEWYWPQRNQDCPAVLVNLYNSSTQTLDIAIYSLTYPSVVQAIKDAKARGVKVRVLSDKTQSAGATQKQAIPTFLNQYFK